MKKKFLLVLTVIALIGLVGCQNTTTAETPLATPTNEPTATSTPVPTATSTPEPTATSTPVPTATSTPVPTATSTPEPTATSTPVPTATSTPVPTATSTPVPTATSTPVPTATSTPVPTATPIPEATALPTPEPTIDANVALSQYTEDQLLDAVLGFWTNDDWYEFTVEKDHITIEKYFYGDVTTYVDVDWTYSGVVTLEDRIVNYASNEYDREEIDFGVYVTFENGVWSDEKGRVYSSDQLIDGSGSGDTASASVEYVDGVWKDYDGNIYEESELDWASAFAEVKFGQKTKALKFTSDIGTFYLYRGSHSIYGSGLLAIERITEDQRANFFAQFKEVEDGTYRFSDLLLNTVEADNN